MRALIKKFKPALNGLALAAHDRSVAIQLGFAVLAGLVGLGLGFVFWEWALVITLAALVITVIVSRTDLLMPATGVVGVTGVVVLLLNVLGPSYRPRLARAADALEIIVLLTILPLAAVVCGTL